MNHCVLAAAGGQNADANPDNIIFNIKIICPGSHIISKKQPKAIKISQ